MALSFQHLALHDSAPFRPRHPCPNTRWRPWCYRARGLRRIVHVLTCEYQGMGKSAATDGWKLA